MLQQTANESCSSNSKISEKAFMCYSFVNDVLLALYDLSLPAASWIFRVLVITLIKLLENEHSNVQFRIFLSKLLIHCYQYILTTSGGKTQGTLENDSKLMENCCCKGKLSIKSDLVICCKACGGLFHSKCVGVSKEDSESKEFSYCCKDCLIKHKALSATALQVKKSF